MHTAGTPVQGPRYTTENAKGVSLLPSLSCVARPHDLFGRQAPFMHETVAPGMAVFKFRRGVAHTPSCMINHVAFPGSIVRGSSEAAVPVEKWVQGGVQRHGQGRGNRGGGNAPPEDETLNSSSVPTQDEEWTIWTHRASWSRRCAGERLPQCGFREEALPGCAATRSILQPENGPSCVGCR